MFQRTEEEKIYVHSRQQEFIFFTAEDADEESLTLAQSFQKRGRLYLYFNSAAVGLKEVKSRISQFRSGFGGEGLLLVPGNGENIHNWTFLPFQGHLGRKMLIFGDLRLWLPGQGDGDWQILVCEESFVFQDKSGAGLSAELEWKTGISRRLSELCLVMNGDRAGCLTFLIQKPGSLREMGVSLCYGVKKEEKDEGFILSPDAYDPVRVYPMEYAEGAEKTPMRGCLDLCAGLWQSRSCLSFNGQVRLTTAFRMLPSGWLHLTADGSVRAAENREVKGSLKTEQEGGEGMTPCFVWEKIRLRKRPAAQEFYLAPSGDFAAEEEGRILLGLCGLEYISVQKGDILRFCPHQEGEVREGAFADKGDTTVSYLTALPGNGRVPCYYSQPQVRPLFRMDNSNILSFCEVPFASMDAAASLPVFPAAGLDGKNVEAGVHLENNVLCLKRSELMEAVIEAQRSPKEQREKPEVRKEKLKEQRENFGAQQGGAEEPGTDPVRAVTEQGILVEYTESSLLADTFERVEFAEGFVFKGVSGKLKASLLSGKCSALISDSEEFTACCRETEMELLVDGWGFCFSPETWEEHETVLILKYTKDLSIQKMAYLPKQWSFATSGAAERLQEKIGSLFGIYREIPQFDKLRKIVTDKEWCGVLVFNGAMSPKQMPAGLAFLSRGIAAEEMEAHHLILKARTLLPEAILRGGQAEALSAAKNAALSPSTVDGLIYYISGLEFGERIPDYSLIVTRLEVIFEDSLTGKFSCEMGLLVNRVFHTLTKPAKEADNSLILISGRYQEQGGVSSYLFELKENTRIGLLSSPVTAINFTTAQLLIGGDAGDDAVDFLLGGELYFEEKSGQGDDGLDLYSYGQASGGLGFTGLCIHMEHQSFELRSGQMVFAAGQSTAREGSFASRIPMNPVSLEMHDMDGVTPSSLGYKGIGVDGMEQAELTDRWSGILWEIPLGDLGLLGEDLSPCLLLLTAFSPDDSVFRSDALRRREDAPTRRYVGVKLSLGKEGGAGTGFSLNLQQFLSLGFRSLELKKSKDTEGSCGILIRDFKLKALNLSMPPGGNSIWIFGAPGAKKLAWFAEYTEEKDGKNIC